ncbi:MAG: hypothetical protein R3Y09_13175 [Clostridia bacterium]
MGLTITNNINIPYELKKIDNNAFWTYSTTTWYKLIYHFTPKKTGALADNISPIQGKEIKYISNYALAQYYGDFNWSTQRNEWATGEWDKAAIRAKKDELLIASMQNYVDSGRLPL